MVDNDTKPDVDAQFRFLIEQGSRLQAAFESEQAVEPRHIAVIRSWMVQALDLIEPTMPPDSAEFNSLAGVREAYSHGVTILPIILPVFWTSG
jgi:hypothetical protein